MRPDNKETKSKFPKKIHLIWIESEEKETSFSQLLKPLIRLTCAAEKSGYEINLWTNSQNSRLQKYVKENLLNLNLESIQELLDNLENSVFYRDQKKLENFIKHLENEMEEQANSDSVYSSLLLKCEILRQQGGFYFDLNLIFDISENSKLTDEEDPGTGIKFNCSYLLERIGSKPDADIYFNPTQIDLNMLAAQAEHPFLETMINSMLKTYASNPTPLRLDSPEKIAERAEIRGNEVLKEQLKGFLVKKITEAGLLVEEFSSEVFFVRNELSTPLKNRNCGQFIDALFWKKSFMEDKRHVLGIQITITHSSAGSLFSALSNPEETILIPVIRRHLRDEFAFCPGSEISDKELAGNKAALCTSFDYHPEIEAVNELFFRALLGKRRCDGFLQYVTCLDVVAVTKPGLSLIEKFSSSHATYSLGLMTSTTSLVAGRIYFEKITNKSLCYTLKKTENEILKGIITEDDLEELKDDLPDECELLQKLEQLFPKILKIMLRRGHASVDENRIYKKYLRYYDLMPKMRKFELPMTELRYILKHHLKLIISIRADLLRKENRNDRIQYYFNPSINMKAYPSAVSLFNRFLESYHSYSYRRHVKFIVEEKFRRPLYEIFNPLRNVLFNSDIDHLDDYIEILKKLFIEVRMRRGISFCSSANDYQNIIAEERQNDLAFKTVVERQQPFIQMLMALWNYVPLSSEINDDRIGFTEGELLFRCIVWYVLYNFLERILDGYFSPGIVFGIYIQTKTELERCHELIRELLVKLTCPPDTFVVHKCYVITKSDFQHEGGPLFNLVRFSFYTHQATIETLKENLVKYYLNLNNIDQCEVVKVVSDKDGIFEKNSKHLQVHMLPTVFLAKKVYLPKGQTLVLGPCSDFFSIREQNTLKKYRAEDRITEISVMQQDLNLHRSKIIYIKKFLNRFVNPLLKNPFVGKKQWELDSPVRNGVEHLELSYFSEKDILNEFKDCLDRISLMLELPKDFSEEFQLHLSALKTEGSCSYIFNLDDVKFFEWLYQIANKYKKYYFDTSLKNLCIFKIRRIMEQENNKSEKFINLEKLPEDLKAVLN